MLARVKQTDQSVPYRNGAYVYYSRTVEGQQYPINCRKKAGSDVEEVLLDHPEVAAHYRDAHRVAVARTKGEADTEELRQAVTAYRYLVEALLADSEHATGRHRAKCRIDSSHRVSAHHTQAHAIDSASCSHPSWRAGRLRAR